MDLHLTKVAVACASYDALAERMQGRAEAGVVHIVTRFRPTRHSELIGGSLYWIIKHRLVGRQEILGFGESEDRRCQIQLSAELKPVLGTPRRAHQGWRYLDAGHAPADLGEWSGDEPLPSRLREELGAIGLL
jgi:hypothetical protein